MFNNYIFNIKIELKYSDAIYIYHTTVIFALYEDDVFFIK